MEEIFGGKRDRVMDYTEKKSDRKLIQRLNYKGARRKGELRKRWRDEKDKKVCVAWLKGIL